MYNPASVLPIYLVTHSISNIDVGLIPGGGWHSSALGIWVCAAKRPRPFLGYFSNNGVGYFCNSSSLSQRVYFLAFLFHKDYAYSEIY